MYVRRGASGCANSAATACASLPASRGGRESCAAAEQLAALAASVEGGMRQDQICGTADGSDAAGPAQR